MSEVTSKIQLSYLKNGSWTSFGTTAQSSMDGIKIQTASDSPYYLQYRTWNEGKDGYYSYVKSNVNDYAGSSGKPIQRLNIQIYKNDGTKLDSGVVIMYRALVDGAWMPWVSNATSDWMRSVRDKYGLGGTLDEANGFTGVTGKNIQGIELHVFEEGEITSGNQDFSSGEVSVSLSYMSGDASNWHAFERSVIAQMDGLKIQTGADKGYYLQYRTWNEGKDGYYPYVTSNVDDYAGSAEKPIQRLNIQVYKSDGTKLDSGVIVMFRALVDGEWMPWVSNATGAWMQDIQNRYNLGGTLDLSNGYTGKAGVNIQGIEIRVFEEDSFSPGAADFDGKEISLSMAYMSGDASNWIDCRNSVIFDSADGLRIQTDPSLPFYLSYRTQNEGVFGYYSDVSSIDTSAAAYAGSAGKPIQRVGIYALDKNGNKLTSGVVFMYRARVEGVWMPWVSNAAPEWMHSVHNQYDLMGTLDTASGHTGVAGKNIDGFEIRIFTGKSNYHPVENLPGTEYAPSLSYVADSLFNWTSFSQKATADHMDGIRIQTDPSKEYYISYRTKNAGNSSYYSFVSSLDTSSSAYAGSAGKPIQRLGIRVYRRSDGAKLTTGVVVMYRVYANGHWLKWVSNADREWMDSARSKYGLDGGMDYVSGYAGLDGYNIQGVEIRVFEENGMEDTPQTPVGQSKIIDAPHVYQNDPKNKFPSGCESASAVMALQYMGYSVSMTDFVTNYLDKAPRTNFHPNIAFGGDPGQSDYGCYAPVIKNAINKILAPTNYEAKELHDVPIATLCSEYIDNDIPVIFWATTDMDPWYYGATLYYNGTSFKWIAPEHCLLLVGYDDNYYYFNDPQKISAKTRYWKADVEAAYAGLLKQAVVIVKKIESLSPVGNYERPEIPEARNDTTILSLIDDIRALENAYVDVNSEPQIGFEAYPVTNPIAITKILRSEAYKDFEWDVTAGPIDWRSVQDIKDKHGDVWQTIKKFILGELIGDGDRGLIDLAHITATIETYLTNSIIPDFWASWGGDLANGMADTTKRIVNRPQYGYNETVTNKQIANATIGDESSRCKYSDFCSDFDAYKIAQMLREEYETAEKEGQVAHHIFSDVLKRYYTQTPDLYHQRFYWLLEELNCSGNLLELKSSIQDKMYQTVQIIEIDGEDYVNVMQLKGDNPSAQVISDCCEALACYIYTMLHE